MAVAARPRERELLATATRLFRQRGCHAASMQDLGEALGMNRGNLYHYIASKDDLLWTILTGALDLLEARVESVLTDERRRQMIQRRNAYEDLWRAALNDGITSGQLRPDIDVRLAGIGILSACNWFTQWYRPDGPMSVDQIADGFIALFLQGLESPEVGR